VRSRVGIAAQAVGAARAALEYALGYAEGRVAFGKPIITHQAVAHRLASMATDIEAARALTYQAARLLDEGRGSANISSMAKLFAADAAERVVREAMQVLGGYGYLRDYPLERIYRDVRVCSVYEGTSDILKTVICNELVLERRT
jgi:alkylation response protein AidB-like acyl-CoA dehydrogenase